MGLGLYLFGDVTKPRDALLEDIEAWVREAHGSALLGSHIGEADDGRRTLWLSLHPAEEELTFKTNGQRRLVASARTSGAGPGYHAFVCELLDGVTERFAVDWQAADPTGETGDETGYFHRRDRPALEQSMVGWLRAIAASLRDRASAEWSGIAVSMPIGAPLYEGEGAATALGPRAADFWERVGRDEAAAKQFFSWWEPGHGAGYLLGRALCVMWSDVRWVAPATPRDERVHGEVLQLLEQAYALDPRREYPLAEWAELAALNDKRLPEGVRAEGAPSIGYRRGAVVAQPFPGVKVRIPGSFAEKIDKRGSWSAWGGGRTVWASLLTAARKPGAPLPEVPPEPAMDELDEGGARVQRLTGKRLMVSGDELRMLVVTVLFTERADAGWARETWESVRLT